MKKYRSAGGLALPAAAPDLMDGGDAEEWSFGRWMAPPPPPLQESSSSSIWNDQQATAVARPKPVRVEIMEEDESKDDDDAAGGDDLLLLDRCSRGTQPRTILHRPVPVRVTEEFYRAAEALPFSHVQAALRASHEWHVRYTGNQPDPTAAPLGGGADASAGLVTGARLLRVDREGAKNPSPSPLCGDDFGWNVRTKRSRNTGNNNNNNWCEPVRREEETKEEPDRVESAARRRPTAQRLRRPVAIRVAAGRVPRDIESGPPARSPSPLSVDGSSSSSGSNLSHRFQPATALEPPASSPQQPPHPAVIECDDQGDCLRRTSSSSSSRAAQAAAPRSCLLETASHVIQQARDGLLHALAVSGGETDSSEFASCLQVLQEHHHLQVDGRRRHSSNAQQAEGLWLTLTKPSFFDCLGDNDRGDPMYTLARMSFNMFCPADLICSLQGNFNGVERVADDLESRRHAIAVPKSLREAVIGDCGTVLRTYNIITAFSIEPSTAAYPNAPNKDVTRPIRGTMTTYGYMIPDPENPARDSVWITGGKIEPHDGDRAAWLALFAAHPPARHGLAQQAQLLAVKWLMGAVLPEGMDAETGVMEYAFSRPLGGHGFAFIDTLYNDDSLRVVRGHRGTYFVFSRMPQGAAAAAAAASN